MKHNKSKPQPTPVSHKTMAIPRELGKLPAGWHQGLTPDSSTDGNEAKSAVFRRFAELLLDENESLSSWYTKYGIAMMGWNLALIPAHARMKPLADLLGNFAADLRLNIKAILQNLVERKDAHFAEYTWHIRSYHLEPKGEGYVLYVAALNLHATP